MLLRANALRVGVRSSLCLLAISTASCQPQDSTEPLDEPAGAEEVVAEAPQAATITRRIPLRFIQLKDCPTPSDCDTGRESTEQLYAAVDRANAVFQAAGVELWIKSNEVLHAPSLASNVSTSRQWGQIAAQMRTIFPDMPSNAYPSGDAKSNRSWLTIGAAYYGDPDVVHVYVLDGNIYDGNDVVGTVDNFAQYPDQGRSLHLVGVGGNTLAHELGHYFGLVHTFDGLSGMFKPGTTTRWSRADRWDLYYCATNPPMFYTSKADYIVKEHILDVCPEAKEKLIDTDAGDRCTSGPDGDGPFDCDLPVTGGTATFSSGDWQLQGLFGEDTSVPHDPPATYRYSANSMGYGSNWPSTGPNGMSGAVPRFYSSSQLDIVAAYLGTEAYYTSAQVQAFARSDGQPLPGDPYAPMSFRTALGEGEEDFVHWANGATGSSPNTEFSFAYQDHPISGNSYETASGDFDGDGNDDILWCSTVSSFASILWGNDDRTFTADDRPGFCPAGFGAIRAGRFNSGAAEDILFYVPGAGTDYIKYGASTRVFTSSAITVDGSSYIPVVGNFDGQNQDDIFWYKPSDSIVYRWYSLPGAGFTQYSAYAVDAGGPFVPVAGNFDGALGDDIFWYKAGSGVDRIWYSLGGGSTSFTKVNSTSNVMGTYEPFSGDFDGDGKDDIFWEKPGSTGDSIWSGAGQSPQFVSRRASVYGTFAPISGDFDGDGLSDIFWYRQ